MRRLGSLRWLSSVCAALVLVTLSGGPAWAADPSASHQTAATRRPDGWVRYYGFYSGVDGYTAEHEAVAGQEHLQHDRADNQTVSKNEAGSYLDGEYFVFKIVVQNDGSNSDSFKVSAPRLQLTSSRDGIGHHHCGGRAGRTRRQYSAAAQSS